MHRDERLLYSVDERSYFYTIITTIRYAYKPTFFSTYKGTNITADVISIQTAVFTAYFTNTESFIPTFTFSFKESFLSSFSATFFSTYMSNRITYKATLEPSFLSTHTISFCTDNAAIKATLT